MAKQKRYSKEWLLQKSSYGETVTREIREWRGRKLLGLDFFLLDIALDVGEAGGDGVRVGADGGGFGGFDLLLVGGLLLAWGQGGEMCAENCSGMLE